MLRPLLLTVMLFKASLIVDNKAPRVTHWEGHRPTGTTCKCSTGHTRTHSMKHLPELLYNIWSSSRRYCFFSCYFYVGFNFHTTNFPTHLFRNYFFFQRKGNDNNNKKNCGRDWSSLCVEAQLPCAVATYELAWKKRKKKKKRWGGWISTRHDSSKIYSRTVCRIIHCHFDCLIKSKSTELSFPNETCISICVISTHFFLREKSFCDRRKNILSRRRRLLLKGETRQLRDMSGGECHPLRS